ncbi:MAG: ABC transporter ATP-binding protein [Candidatus Hydrogenedentota bacterium]|nr:MAG: ABC transporter ATP-binding protein [Candidatus Hydrogenedentota bacterium]
MAFLEFRGVCATYGGPDVLHDLNFSVERNEIVTLIGANGAGKTTTLLALSGLVRKSAGSIIFDGEDITNLAPHKIVQRGIIHVPEGRGIFPRLTVMENLTMGAYSVGKVSEEKLEAAFRLFPILEERKAQPGGTLSGGEQQMLAIARGLMPDPKLLLLDEPSLGVAPMLVEKIFEALREIHASGTPILLVEQNAHKALELADRGYVIENGRLGISGSGQELLRDPRIMEAYLGI